MARHALRVEPHAHGQALTAKRVDLGHPFKGGKQRLHHAAEVVGQGGGGQGVAGKADVGDGRGVPGRTLDDRVIGLLGQAVFDLIDLGNHFTQRLGRIFVKRHAQGNHAVALHRR